MAMTRIYRMTVASKWYDELEAYAREFEMHLKAARRGKIRNVRRHLAKRGIDLFQDYVYKKTEVRIPKGDIRIGFEKEERARKSKRLIKIESRSMRFRGKEWKASALPSKTVPYSKKRARARKITAFSQRVMRNVKKWFKRLLGG